MNITFFLIATDAPGKESYKKYVATIVKSINEYFVKGANINIWLFTDDIYYWEKKGKRLPPNVYFKLIQHTPWPGSTLFRFHYFMQFFHMAAQPQFEYAITEYCFYVDVDARFVAPVSAQDVLADGMTGTQHCGFVGKRGTYETNPESSFYVGPNEGKIYYAGGFYGGRWNEFLQMSNELSTVITYDCQRISEKYPNGIIPVHNDESALNRYFINHPPAKTLSPEFHYPEELLGKNILKYNPKLLLAYKWDKPEYTDIRERGW